MKRIARPAYCLLISPYFLLLLWVSVSDAQSAVDADSTLRRVRQLYEEGSYLSAELEGRRLLEQTDLRDSVHNQVEKYVAFSLIAQDKPQSAVSHFWAILERDSSFGLDPQMTSPKILTIFQSTRDKFRMSHSPAQELIASPAASSVSYRAIVFPGWEQLHQGRSATGYAFVSVGAASLVGTIYFDFMRRDARDSYLQAATSELAASRYTKFDKYYKAELYSAILYALTYVVSEAEVFTAQGRSGNLSVTFARQTHERALGISIRF